MLVFNHELNLLQGADSWFELSNIRIKPVFYPVSRATHTYRNQLDLYLTDEVVKTNIETQGLPPKIWQSGTKLDLRHIDIKGIARTSGANLVKSDQYGRAIERLDRASSLEDDFFYFMQEEKIYEAAPIPRLLYETKVDPKFPVTRLFVRVDNYLIVQPTGKTGPLGGSSKGFLLTCRTSSLFVPISTIECMPIAFSSQGRFVAIASRKIVIVYLAETLRPIKTFNIPNTMSLTFTPDETILACIGCKKTILLDVESI